MSLETPSTYQLSLLLKKLCREVKGKMPTALR
jgi:hypothetical protein